MTVVVTAVFHPADGRRADLVDALRRTIPAVHTERGCLLYAIHEGADGTIVMLEKWDSAADLAEHSTGAAVRELRAAIDGLTSGPAAVTTMTPIPAGTEDQGLL